MKNDKCDRRFDCDDYKYDHCEGCGGNKPQGDLISREALKKEFQDRLSACEDWINHTECDISRAIATRDFCIEVIMNINNAPTVEQEVKLVPVAKVTFDEEKLREIVHREVIDKIQSGELVVQAEERKIGKWVKNIYPDGSYNFICLACNTTSAEDSQYCQNCGAYMIKEDEDE